MFFRNARPPGKDTVTTAEEIVNPVIRKYPCCSAWTIPVASLRQREQDFFQARSLQPVTAIVVGHHVETMAEWTWSEREDGSHHCDADDHTVAVCEEIREALSGHWFRARILPYPGECGLQFRSVAEAAGAGEIATNVFLLHPEWGPWIQLRVMETNAPSGSVPAPSSRKGICDKCGGACIEACPAGAIQRDSFNGLRCRQYRTKKGEYIPIGPKKEFRYCTMCADVCPAGKRPV